MGKTTLLLGGFFLILFLIIIIRTLTFGDKPPGVIDCDPKDTDFIKAEGDVLENFRKALQFETIARKEHDFNREPMLQYVEFIKSSYPAIHGSPLVTMETVANYSLLYRIEGSQSALTPYLLMAHLDVVPISHETWEAPPFAADIINGFIYGRGTIDDKHMVMGILEALEYLLKKGHRPKRSFYIAFGHDEEVNGIEGAQSIGHILESRGLQFEYIVDEGLTVVDGVINGMEGPVALIGTSEKGYLTLELSVQTQGGHSSMPGKESSIGILANAIARLENSPQPSMFGTGPERGLFEQLAPHMKLGFKTLMSNLWLFSPLVTMVLSWKPSSNAMVRTTTAVTEFHAGIKSNVLAPKATATVNHRVHPGQTLQQVIEHDRYVINDPRVEIRTVKSVEAHPVSPYDTKAKGYQTIKKSIRQVFHKAVVAPGLMIGNTDTKHYLKLSKNIYRFSPTYMYPEDLPRFHGVNERISVKNYEQAINYYYHLMKNSDDMGVPEQHQHSSEL
ncbi:unnamed protein product [Owenia fusiformis]|uniref:Peptidase M20 dimerisation domain-containing protein n=1 Tax=Owenia fusiformis TaxID=6347 RepID=A0A8S4NQ98_OWEFU|nr:unnamed protein product [Owenia fusiformis]